MLTPPLGSVRPLLLLEALLPLVLLPLDLRGGRGAGVLVVCQPFLLLHLTWSLHACEAQTGTGSAFLAG